MSFLASNVYRWGNGRFIADPDSGSVGILPDLNDATISDFGNVLDAFPNGLCLHIVGNVVREVRVFRVGEDICENLQNILSQVHVAAASCGELNQDLGETESAQDGTGRGNIHSKSFVLVVLPEAAGDAA